MQQNWYYKSRSYTKSNWQKLSIAQWQPLHAAVQNTRLSKNLLLCSNDFFGGMRLHYIILRKRVEQTDLTFRVVILLPPVYG